MRIIDQKTFLRFLFSSRDRDFLFYPRIRGKCVKKEFILLTRCYATRVGRYDTSTIVSRMITERFVERKRRGGHGA